MPGELILKPVEKRTLWAVGNIGGEVLSQQVGERLGHVFPQALEVRRPQLEMLSRLGFLARRKVFEGRTNHVYYSLTDAGRAALHHDTTPETGKAGEMATPAKA